MSLRWQISAGELFELTRPATFVLSALASTWVLASARRRGFNLYAIAAWTLGTLFFTLTVLPVYLIVRATRRRQERSSQTTASQENNAAPSVEPTIEPTETVEPANAPLDETTQEAAPEVATQAAPKVRTRLRFILPLAYLLAVLALETLLYYRDAQSVDAHLARANQSRLLGQREKTIREYRAALKLEEDGHTRNLLGIELAAAGQLDEALAEFRAAESAGEPDDELPYRIATTLDALNRQTEAVPEYQKFLNTRRCKSAYPDPQCEAARASAGAGYETRKSAE